VIPLAEKVEASTESNPGIFGFGALGEHLAVVLQSTVNNPGGKCLSGLRHNIGFNTVAQCSAGYGMHGGCDQWDLPCVLMVRLSLTPHFSEVF